MTQLVTNSLKTYVIYYVLTNIGILIKVGAVYSVYVRAPSRIIQKKEVVQVKVGRRAFISPTQHLRIIVEDGDNCEVRVLFSHGLKRQKQGNRTISDI